MADELVEVPVEFPMLIWFDACVKCVSEASSWFNLPLRLFGIARVENEIASTAAGIDGYPFRISLPFGEDPVVGTRHDLFEE